MGLLDQLQDSLQKGDAEQVARLTRQGLDEKIDVKYDLDPEPEGNELGVVKWKFEVGSNNKVTLFEKFTITHPEDVSVTPPLP